MDKNLVIQENIGHRETEVAMYDINIENYKRMLERIDKDFPGDDPVSLEIKTSHKARLEELLHTEQVERAKSKLVLDVMKDQVK